MIILIIIDLILTLLLLQFSKNKRRDFWQTFAISTILIMFILFIILNVIMATNFVHMMKEMF